LIERNNGLRRHDPSSCRRSLESATVRRLGHMRVALALIAALLAVMIGSVRAQEAPSAEAVRTIEHGKDIFKTKATCQFCHKWDASGDQGYGGNALSLRQTKLTSAQVAETVKCGLYRQTLLRHHARGTRQRCAAGAQRVPQFR
jgi:hypothetical protein